MRIDIHCHVVGKGKDIKQVEEEVYFNPYDNKIDGKLVSVWLLYKYVETLLLSMGADKNHDVSVSTDEYLDFLYQKLLESDELDGIVLLAHDAVYDSKTGKIDKKKTDLWVTNRFLFKEVQHLNRRFQDEADITKRKKRFFLGASVSPNRSDWKEELEYVIDNTDAVLLKWIPSAMHIDIKNVPNEFYRMLEEAQLPLLCHVGPELSFAEGMKSENRHLDDFKNLKKPVEAGVKVIAAHCALPLPILSAEPNRFDEFKDFMKSTNSNGIKLWADTSALTLTNRLPFLPDVKRSIPPEWLVHGADFPIPVDSGILLPLFVPRRDRAEYEDIRNCGNPFDRDIKIKRAFGFSNSIMENAENVVRLRS
jgi:hypothetical protein